MTKTHKMLKQTFGEEVLGQTQSYDWFKCFKNGIVSVDDDERFGRLLTSTMP